MVAISDHPTGTAPAASFDIAIPSQPVTNTLLGPTFGPSVGQNCFAHSPSYGPSNAFMVQSFSMQNPPMSAMCCFGPSAYNPSSPAYSPSAPAYSPSAPAYSPSAPAYSPSAPAYSGAAALPQNQQMLKFASHQAHCAPPPHAASFGAFSFGGPSCAASSFGGAFFGGAPVPLDDSRLVSRQEYLAKRDVKNLQALTADLEDEEFLFPAAKLTAQEVNDVEYKREVLEKIMARAAPVPLCAPPPQDDSFGPSPLEAGTKKSKLFATDPSLLDVLGALQSASWSPQHPVVAAFLIKHLPTMVHTSLTSDAHATVGVIVVLRAKFKDSKAGWHAHVKRAAHSARLTLGDSEYASLKVSLVHAISV